MGLLSWLRGSGGANGDSLPGPAAPGPQPRADSGAFAEPGWRSAAPVQRTLGGAMGLVTDPVGFRQRLGSWQDPTITGPLGHLVSAQAPAGTGHGLAAPSVQRTESWTGPRTFDAPKAVEGRGAIGAPRGTETGAQGHEWGEPAVPSAGVPVQEDFEGPVQAAAVSFADQDQDQTGSGVPTVSRTVSLDLAPRPAPGAARSAPLPLAPLQRTPVPSPVSTSASAPSAPVTVMRVPSVASAPVPPRPLTVAEQPDVPARELAAIPVPVPDDDPGPMAPGAPVEPVADLLAAQATGAEAGAGSVPTAGEAGEGAVVQRSAFPAAPGAPESASLPFPLRLSDPGQGLSPVPESGTSVPVVPVSPPSPVVQRGAMPPGRPPHRGLGEPLSALPPTARPLLGPAAPLAGTSGPSSAGPHQGQGAWDGGTTPDGHGDPGTESTSDAVPVSRVVELPQPQARDLPDPSGTPDDGMAPLLGDAQPLTTGGADIGTGPGVVQRLDVPGRVPDALSGGPAPRAADPGTSQIFAGDSPGNVSGTASAQPDVVPPSAPEGEAPVVARSVDEVTAPLLGDAELLAVSGVSGVSDTPVPEAPGPGEMVTAATPMPLRRLDAVGAR